ncbi:hypothetical protein SBV1_2760003 [Verrucomicrobia bacterium]|nr:hypothetical protein SBV1_2760003 [Verrucomicrobiota bacterium]
MNDDMSLVRQYAASQSESAFTALVERYIDLVHSAALRQAGDADLAEEIAQAVFVILARKAARLGPNTILSAWLYRTTRYVAADALRARRRRQAREQEAYMQSTLNEPQTGAWEQMAPLLDEAMGALGEGDRSALVLRFFENKTAPEIASVLRLSPEAAQKRVTRAVEKLRRFFSKRGVTLSAAAIAASVSANSVKAAPAGLAASVAKGVAAGIPISPLAAGVMKTMTGATIKTGLAAGAAVLAVILSVELAMQHRSPVVPDLLLSAVQPPTTNSALAPAAATNSSYSLVALDPTPGFDSLHVASLNNRGQVVGSLDSTNQETHAFIWENGLLTDLGTFGGAKSLASGINDAGDIVGTILTNGERHAFLRHNGAVSDLGLIDDYAKLGLEGTTYYTPCVTINDQAQVTGHLTVANDHRSFVLNQGQTAYFGLLGKTSIFYAEAINNRGQILGRATPTAPGGPMRSMLWQDGQVIDLSSLDGTESKATALNDRGAVVGWTLPTNGASGQPRGFIWENGALRWLNPGDSAGSYPCGINNAGQVVGYARTPEGHFVACLWTGDQMVDLNDLVGVKSGWRLVSAESINDRGQILARAVNGKRRCACLLSPADLAPVLPEEPTVATAASGSEAGTVAPFSLTSFERLPSGAFRLGFTGRTDGQYVVEASTNLVTWTLLGPATNESGKVEFTDLDAPRFTLRFYRLKRLQ